MRGWLREGQVEEEEGGGEKEGEEEERGRFNVCTGHLSSLRRGSGLCWTR